MEQNEILDSSDPITIKDLMSVTYKEGRWLVQNLLPENGITILSGEPASFKTWVVLHIALMVASGGKVFGNFQSTQGAVLVVDEENRHALLADRLGSLSADENLPIHFLVKRGFQISDEDEFIELHNFIGNNNIKLVTFDSLVRIHSGDENDSRQVAEVYKKLNELQQLGVTILITHHHRKEIAGRSGRKSQSLRGSSDILAGLDSHIAITRKGNSTLELAQTKSRDAEELEDFKVTIISENEKITFQYDGNAEANTKERAKVKILEQLTNNGELPLKEIIEKLQPIGKAAIYKSVQELLTENKIVERHADRNRKFYNLPT